MRQIPGVANAASRSHSPMSGQLGVDHHGRWPRYRRSGSRHPGTAVSPRLLRYGRHTPDPGRALSTTRRPDAPPVVVVSETFARRFFGEADPSAAASGSRSNGAGRRTVRDCRRRRRREVSGRSRGRIPTFFLPFLQQPPAAGDYVRPHGLDRSHYPAGSRDPHRRSDRRPRETVCAAPCQKPTVASSFAGS